MRTLRMTMLLSAVLGATASAAAGGQTARDTAVMRANALKTRLDSTNTLSTVPLGNYCRQYTTIGWFKNGPCLWQAPLLTRANSDLTSLLLVMARLTKTDTVIKRDTLIRVVHDTVFVQQPTPTPVVAVATVTTSLASRSLTVGQTTQASAVAKDSAGAILTRAVTWSSSAPAVASVSASGLVTALSAGTSQITAKVETKSSYTTLTVTAPIPPPADTTTPPIVLDIAPELPRVFLNTAVSNTPSTGRTLTVSATGNLQTALDTAQSGDKIVLACGASYVGQYTLPVKVGTGWVTVTSNGCASVAEGQRMTPALAANLPKIKSTSNGPAFRTAIGAERYRLSLLEVTADATAQNNTWGLVNIGEGNETSLTQIPKNIILDRLYLHGRPDLDIMKGVVNNGASVALIDSWVSDIHSVFDSNGIAGWNGPGPYKIVNNTIESGGVSIGSGGAYVSLAGNVPSDWEIRRNHLTKNLAWVGKWVLKNNLEFKSARRVLIEGNVLDNSPVDAQNGFAMMFWSADQYGQAPWTTTNNLTVRYNLMRNTASGFSLSADNYVWKSREPMHHVWIHNNVFIGIDGPTRSGIGGSFGRLFVIADTISQLVIEHNTGFSPSSSSLNWSGSKPLKDHRILNNVFGGGPYPIFNGAQGAAAWTQEAGPGSSFLGNVIADIAVPVPTGNHAPAMANVGLVGGAAAAFSVSATLDQMALGAGTWYKGAATDGTDPGADIAKVKAATAGVVITQPMSTRRIPLRKP